eukprot:TRINITY_DN334_c0_g1_i1.p1 TRINITY_DN334_c0_g1~~TRINITY_DN334_c0_g1_i1.p1  ORF type:complete len:110 (-),score=30.70 TRINITY_DN334_c0_g1_i1:157-486(-)
MEAVQGSIGEFTIQSRDRFSNNRETSCGEEIIVAVDHSNPKTQSKVIDNYDGTYTARYSREELGLQLISVTVDGSAIVGSPFIIFVQPEDGVPRESDQALPTSDQPWWP